MSTPRLREPVGPGQESVWDYPRPPLLRASDRLVEIVLGGELICRTTASLQVLETSHPPTWYLPRSAFAPDVLAPTAGASFCEWKGAASYLDVHGGGRTAARAAWYYPSPTPTYTQLKDHIALYAAAMDSCRVDGVQVVAQPGGFYGGWITRELCGPFKGEPGTGGW